jgi:ribosomal protein S1
MISQRVQNIIDSDLFQEHDANFASLLEKSLSASPIPKKDALTGDLLAIHDIFEDDSKYYTIELSSGAQVSLSKKREVKFLERIYPQIKDFTTLEELKNFIKEIGIKAYIRESDSKISASIREGWYSFKRQEFMSEVKDPKKVYFGRISSRNKGGFFVIVEGVETFLPGSQAAANKINNFEDLIGKEIPVMFENFLPQTDSFIVSNKRYIQNILPQLADKVEYNKMYPGRVTGITPYAIFVEFYDVLTGMLHRSEMGGEVLEKFENQTLVENETINFYVKSVDNLYRFILTSKTLEERNAQEDEEYNSFVDYKQYEGSVQRGKITRIRQNGVFVKLDDNVTGMISGNEAAKFTDLRQGDFIDVFVSRVLPDELKVFLRYPRGHKQTTDTQDERR